MAGTSSLLSRFTPFILTTSTDWDDWEILSFWEEQTVDDKLKIDKLFKETWEVPGTIKPLGYIVSTGGLCVRSASIEVELTPQEPSKIDSVQSEFGCRPKLHPLHSPFKACPDKPSTC
ncbi:hypothetical protein B0H19DRAFT_1258687 [Mycena capillaripes]|nr:hypothetical protein B0H19DRAFT_1258687 [Mycena capillaripes]